MSGRNRSIQQCTLFFRARILDRDGLTDLTIGNILGSMGTRGVLLEFTKLEKSALEQIEM